MSRPLSNPAFETTFANLRRDTQGDGRPILILHGGGGPRTVAVLTQALASYGQVLSPTHPGFDGTSRSEELNSIKDLAAFYVQMLRLLNLSDALVIGSSIGGWIASEMALLPDNRIAGLILIDPVGIAVAGDHVADVFTLSPMDLMDRVFHAPETIRANAPPPSDAQKAIAAADLKTLAAYDQRSGMQDPSLRERLAVIKCPALVLWGESDGVASLVYGQAYAAALSGAKFHVIKKAGHLPQIEQPELTIKLIREFLAEPRDAFLNRVSDGSLS